MVGSGHANHHKRGTGQGVFGEFLDYVRATIIISVVLSGLFWLIAGPALAVGFLVGGIGFAGFSAYSHQLQHERPDLVFWMPMPIHHIHHHQHQWHHNFGISVDWWDRILGTYKPVQWQRAENITIRDLLNITWRKPPRHDVQPEESAHAGR